MPTYDAYEDGGSTLDVEAGDDIAADVLQWREHVSLSPRVLGEARPSYVWELSVLPRVLLTGLNKSLTNTDACMMARATERAAICM